MAHLSPEELIDIAEGAREAPPHAASCDECRRALDDLRAMMASIADVDVPEPSPLFWERFSARVSEAVSSEPEPPRRWLAHSRLAVPLAALAAAALVVVVWVSRPADGLRAPAGASASAPEAQRRDTQTPPGTQRPDLLAAGSAAQPPAAPPRVSGAPAERTLLSSGADDASFAFVVDLANDMQMDTVEAAGLAPDSADHAVAHLSESELRALADLLREQMPNGRVS